MINQLQPVLGPYQIRGHNSQQLLTVHTNKGQKLTSGSYGKPYDKKGVPSAESSRSVRGLGKGVSGKLYPRLCNARSLRLEHGTFWSQAVRLYRLHQACPFFILFAFILC